MKTILHIILSSLLFAFISVSCKVEDFSPYGDEIELDEPALLQLTLTDGEMQSKGTGLSDTEEVKINSVVILVFDQNGHIVTNQYFPSYNPATGLQSVKTRSGISMSIYAFANISAQNANFTNMFENVSTVSDLNSLKVYNIGDDISQNRRLIMWGVKTGVTIPSLPSTANVSFGLNYVVSKVRVHIIDDTPADEDFSLVDWQVGNGAKFSNLLPKASDAVNPANAADYGSSAPLAWTDTTFVVGGVPKVGKYTVLYLFENRRGGRVANNSTPPSGYTPGIITSGDPRDKVWYAPSMATYLNLNGYYHTAAKHTGVTAKIYFGANSYNDYNVERGKSYTFVVTIKGIDQIDIDSRIDGNSRGYQADVLNTTLDCHYDWRELRLGAFGGNLTVEVLDAAGTAASDWLKVSAININKFVNNNGTYNRPTYNPATDMVTTISGIAFVDGPTVTFKSYYLYAPEYLVEGVVRTAQVKITSSDVGSQPIIIPITQKGYQTMGTVGLRKFTSMGEPLPTSGYKLIVENQEEATMNLTPGSATGVESTSTMQWGFNNIEMQPFTSGSILFGNYLRNGYENSTNLVLSNITNGTLRAPYGRTGTNTITEAAHNSIFNTYAARYCFEKNRDENGDGVIKDHEIKWYLPSLDELLLIYVGAESLSQISGEKISGNPYQSSTEFTAITTNMGVRFDIGRTGTLAKNTSIYVRCVRAI